MSHIEGEISKNNSNERIVRGKVQKKRERKKKKKCRDMAWQMKDIQ